MIFGRIRTVLIGSLLVSVSIVGQKASGQEVSSQSAEVEKTFIVDIAKAASFQEDIDALKKVIVGKDKLGAVDMPDLGISMVTGTFSEKEIEELRSKGYEERDSLEVNLFRNGMCEGRELLAAWPTDIVPPSVCRVIGNPPSFATGPTVWIIDSGVDALAASEGQLNVRDFIDCTSSPCQSGLSPVDDTGHGTAVAGIIGGKRGRDVGLLGIAPGAPLKVVRAFQGNKAQIFGAPLLALDYVRANASPGDIVNLSWGAEFLESARSASQFEDLKIFDARLYEMADRPMHIVIAAGNAQQDDEGSWVQSYFPANAALYGSLLRGGIYSVSASDSTFETTGSGNCTGVNNVWCDTLWRGGAFGAPYAAPGVDVMTLWKSKNRLRRNVCSGTSFAAPALAGLLARNATVRTTAIRAGRVPNPNADRVVYNTAGVPDLSDPDHPTCR